MRTSVSYTQPKIDAEVFTMKIFYTCDLLDHTFFSFNTVTVDAVNYS